MGEVTYNDQHLPSHLRIDVRTDTDVLLERTITDFNNPWMPAEDDYIRTHMHMSYSAIGRAIGRTEHATMSRALRLGLRKRPSKMGKGGTR